MEDLWRTIGAGVDIEDFADMVEYRRFLKRFHDEEVKNNSRNLLYGAPLPAKKETAGT